MLYLLTCMVWYGSPLNIKTNLENHWWTFKKSNNTLMGISHFLISIPNEINFVFWFALFNFWSSSSFITKVSQPSLEKFTSLYIVGWARTKSIHISKSSKKDFTVVFFRCLKENTSPGLLYLKCLKSGSQSTSNISTFSIQ